MKKGENWVAGATILSEKAASRGLPIPLPEEVRNLVQHMLDHFFCCGRTSARPLAGVEMGPHDSTGVILANRVLEEGRRVSFEEMHLPA